MNVWKSIIIGLMGVWLLAGCGSAPTEAESEATKAFKQLLQEKHFYQVDTFGTQYDMYFYKNGSYERNATLEDGRDGIGIGIDYEIKDNQLTFFYVSDEICDLKDHDERSVTMKCAYENDKYTWVIWNNLQDAIDNPADLR